MSDRDFRVVMDCRTDAFFLQGELDSSSAGSLRKILAGVRTPTVVLDLSQLTSIDRAGLACIAAAAQYHSRVVLRGLRPRHDPLLEIVRSRPQFEIEPAPDGDWLRRRAWDVHLTPDALASP